ncbi:MAG: polysaccharide biosynthesis protein [Deltaproteobacteria bacterium]|nr:polysaccharide biosynthesis protein [Deltaproteobacteria bacterium]
MKKIISRLLHPTYIKRTAFFFIFDIVIIAFSLYFSFLVRFDFDLTDEYRRLAVDAIPIFILVKLSVFSAFRLSRITWKYVGLRDLINISAALLASEAVLALIILFPPAGWAYFSSFIPDIKALGFPRSIFIIDAANSLLLLLTLRVSKRLYVEFLHGNGSNRNGLKTVIIGAGNAGEMILRDMSRHNGSGFSPAGFLDDDRTKIGTYIHGVKVLGATDMLRDVVLKKGIKAMIIAIPSLNQKTLRNIYDSARDTGVETIKIVPRIYDYDRPEVNLKSLETISIEDILGRRVVEVDYGEIRKFLKDKVVLVTGAGGSIGSEIAVQALGCGPSQLILFDIDETELHNMEIRLKRTFPHLFRQGGNGKDRPKKANHERVSFVVGDVRDMDRVDSVLSEYRPQVVFHAAAYKHVPMMEHNPDEAVKVNVFGAHRMASASVRHGVGKFIMISTDKAVRPTSVMGATKRIAEYVCKAYNGEGGTEFVSVRFGNVLGSRGSVLPLFLEQLKAGGPITVTHRDMKRYFMTIPEAVSLVLQAGAIGRGGDVLVLDMGDPVRIVELAEELIRIHGLEPHKDIDIEFVHMRPGEKLFEEILTAEEGTTASRHKQIFIARESRRHSRLEIEKILKEFESRLDNGRGGVRELLKKHVVHYEADGREATGETGARSIHAPEPNREEAAGYAGGQ